MRLLVARSRRSSPSRAAFRIALPALLTLVRGACFVDDQGCCAFDETAAKADADTAKPFCTALCTTDITDTDAPCYVPSAHCEAGACACDAPLENSARGPGQFASTRCAGLGRPSNSDLHVVGGLGRRRRGAGYVVYLASLAAQVAGWLFVGKELWRLLRFWGEGRAPFLIMVACACLLAVCGLALLGRSLLCVALVENLSETLSWLIAGINELVFSLLLSAALSVNLLWVVVGRRLVAVPSWYRLALGALAVLSPPLCLLLLALGQLSVYEVLNLLAYSVVGAGFVFHARRLKATLEASDDLNDLSFVPPAVKTAWRLAALCVGCVLLELFNFALSAWRGRTARDASDALVWVEAMVPLDLLWTWTIWKYLESQRWLDLESSLPDIGVAPAPKSPAGAPTIDDAAEEEASPT